MTALEARLRRVQRQSLRAAGVPVEPAHRADVPVDSCREGVRYPNSAPCVSLAGGCAGYEPRHAAARVAEDERRAL